MKVKFLIPAVVLFLFTIGCHQTDSNLNLSFEDIENGMPKSWEVHYQKLTYSVSLDSTNAKSGKYALGIEFIGDSVSFQVVSLILPYNYNGEKINLSGYIKTENVTEGFAGLWMWIEPAIAGDTLRDKVTGTSDWKRYEITLDMNPLKTQKIIIGGYLKGNGKMWLDDLKVTIDGKDVNKVKPYQPKPFPAKNDKEFDKGSNIVFPEMNEQKIDDLELLGRIWGFLKYYHPEISKGTYNWDYELFRILPNYLEANNHQHRDKILIKWINKYGRIPICKTCQATSDSAFLKPDLSWIEKSNINLKLKDLLRKIYVNRSQGNHYYIEMRLGVGNPVFSNERTYEALADPDAGFRLLALYRYWNMIYYFFPYKHLTDKNWNTVLKEYTPYFINTKNRLEYELITARLLGEVCDSHAFLLGFEQIESLKGDGQVCALVQFVENQLVVMEYYFDDSRLKRGDVITHIEGKPVEAIIDSMKKYYPASNEAARMRDIARDILRTDKQSIQIDYISSGKKERKEIYLGSRDEWMYYRYRRKDTTRCYQFIGKDIGYVTLKNIKGDDIPAIKQKFMNTKGIIIDIRNYPSATVMYTLGAYFVSNTTPFVKFTKGNPDNPGEFTFKSKIDIPKSETTYQGKLVVIVNEETQSSAEFQAMAFQAGDNTTVIGSTTAGADGNVSEIDLPGGLKTNISGVGVYYPDGRETQRVGIVPDIVVKPTIVAIREVRDELLEKAIEIIRQESK